MSRMSELYSLFLIVTNAFLLTWRLSLAYLFSNLNEKRVFPFWKKRYPFRCVYVNLHIVPHCKLPLNGIIKLVIALKTFFDNVIQLHCPISFLVCSTKTYLFRTKQNWKSKKKEKNKETLNIFFNYPCQLDIKASVNHSVPVRQGTCLITINVTALPCTLAWAWRGQGGPGVPVSPPFVSLFEANNLQYFVAKTPWRCLTQCDPPLKNPGYAPVLWQQTKAPFSAS